MIRGFLIAYLVIASFSLILYLPKLIQFRYAFKKPQRKQATAMRKIAIVVAARNESKTIGPLLESVKRQNYPKEFFDLNVIVKEFDDPTLDMVRQIGGNTFVVPEQTCKGDVLDGFFKILGNRVDEYDAFVIVDADAVISPNYLSALNEALEYDCDIFISRKLNRNLYGGRKTRSLFSNCAALLWPMLDDLSNSWRTQHDVPLYLCGQGMMVRSSVVKKIGGWPYRTLTEDYELRLDSILKGFKSMYYPYAELYTEEAVNRNENYNRRLRWLTGYQQCDKIYRKQIKEQGKARGKYSLAERDYLFGFTPIILFAVITVVTMVAGTVLCIVYSLQQSPLWNDALMILIVIPFAVLYVLLLLYSLLAYLACKNMFSPLSLGEKIAMMLFNPFYLLEYCPIYIKGIFYVRKGKSPVWKETKRVDYQDENETDDNATLQ